MIRTLVSNAIKFSPPDSVATLHAVFVPNKEGSVISSDDKSLFSFISARHVMRRTAHIVAWWRRRTGSVSAAENISKASSSSAGPQVVTGYLRISVVDQG